MHALRPSAFARVDSVHQSGDTLAGDNWQFRRRHVSAAQVVRNAPIVTFFPRLAVGGPGKHTIWMDAASYGAAAVGVSCLPEDSQGETRDQS